MFRLFMSSEQRKLQSQLEELDLLSDTLPIKLQEYQVYFRHLVVVEPGLNRHIQLLSRQKLTPVGYVKVLVFLHCWLQTTCLVEQPEMVLHFINHLLSQLSLTIEKTKRARLSSEKKMGKSQVFNKSSYRYQQMELSKELFLMEDVAKPYMFYLQKLIAIFEFYNILKKNFSRPLGHPEIWVLVNLFHNIATVTNNVAPICKFIRKSYRPLAEALALTFSQDVSHLYPKLYKFSQGQASKIKNQFLQWQNRRVPHPKWMENIDGMIILMTEIRVINKAMKNLYEEPVIHHLDNIYIPKLIELESREFELMEQLSRLKKEEEREVVERLTTPKFATIRPDEGERLESQENDPSEGEDNERQPSLFRDITNQDDKLVTFRKEELDLKGFLKKARTESEEEQPKVANCYGIESQNENQ